jgi:hypothetical protein
MSNGSPDRLYGLLPAIYRIRDSAQSEPLRALLGLIETEYDAIEQNIAALYDDWFIETCDQWVVPYIGDLLDVRPINGAGGAFSARAYVAHTLRYRQSKGTAAMLELLAHDVTGWPARVVEYFQLLDTCQYLNHLRPQNLATPDLRDAASLELLGGPFETTAHTVDVRSIATRRGRYNIANIGVFFWRLQVYRVGPISLNPTQAELQSDARAAAAAPDGRYTLDPLGADAPLFNLPQTNTDTTRLTGEINVPGLLRRRPLYEELEALRQAKADGAVAPPAPVYFGANPAFQILVNNAVVPFEQIAICDIEDVSGDWRRPATTKAYRPASGGAAINLPIALSVDPVRGRIAFPPGVTPSSVEVSYVYGFSAGLGAGVYDRSAWLTDELARPKPLNDGSRWQVGVAKQFTTVGPNAFSTLDAAIKAWNAQTTKSDGVIAICDNRTYHETLTAINLAEGRSLLIVAADWPALRKSTSSPANLDLSFDNLRPHVRAAIAIQGSAPANSADAGECFIDGLLIDGGITIEAGELAVFSLSQSTVAPSGGLDVAAGSGPAISLYRTICGPIVLSATTPSLSLTDSIVASGQASSATAAAITAPASNLNLQTTTVFGTTSAELLSASDSIFAGLVTITRQQSGCMRFCYAPPNSKTAPRYRCQPDLALNGVNAPSTQDAIKNRLIPQFTSTSFGQPGFAQLAANCASEIAAGADNGSEMGAFNFLYQPQRSANLSTALDEYLRFGLEAGSFNVT